MQGDIGSCLPCTLEGAQPCPHGDRVPCVFHPFFLRNLAGLAVEGQGLHALSIHALRALGSTGPGQALDEARLRVLCDTSPTYVVRWATIALQSAACLKRAVGPLKLVDVPLNLCSALGCREGISLRCCVCLLGVCGEHEPGHFDSEECHCKVGCTICFDTLVGCFMCRTCCSSASALSFEKFAACRGLLWTIGEGGLANRRFRDLLALSQEPATSRWYAVAGRSGAGEAELTVTMTSPYPNQLARLEGTVNAAWPAIHAALEAAPPDPALPRDCGVPQRMMSLKAGRASVQATLRSSRHENAPAEVEVLMGALYAQLLKTCNLQCH